MRRALVVLIASTGLGGSGCFYDVDSVDVVEDVEDAEPASATEHALAVWDPVLEGQAGDVSVAEPTTARITVAQLSGDQLLVELRSRGRGGVLMQRYTVDGYSRLAPGDEVVSRAETFVATGDRQPPVDTLGCSGREDGVWDFDQVADEVVLQVSEGPEPGGLRLAFTSRFESYGDEQIVLGSLVVQAD